MGKILSVIFVWSLVGLFIWACIHFNKKHQKEKDVIYIENNSQDTLTIKIIRK